MAARFSAPEVIAKKRDGKELSASEIRGLIEGLQSGEVADYQATAFLMAVYFRGMTLDETVALTQAMLDSGERYDLGAIPGHKSDKHSTGGVGDKVSLILAPLAAACGLKVPMMSGRGLGHSGGTLDKLESIPGFNVKLNKDQFSRVLKDVGCAMIGQSDSIAPADKKLYALRDVTGTVECVPLIVASILSKKLAEGTESLVLDVKTGSGAFMKTRERSKLLAKTLAEVAKKLKLPTRALITDMNQPLGYAVGNALEVRECIEILKRGSGADLNTSETEGPTAGSADLRELTLVLCAQMLEVSGLVKSHAGARKLAQDKLNDGSAWTHFQKLVAAQGGSLKAIENLSLLPAADRRVVIKAKKRGYVVAMNTERIGRLCVDLGGGRKKVTDAVDPGVGIVFHKKLGSKISAGEPLATLHVRDAAFGKFGEAWTHELQDSVSIAAGRRPVPKLIQK